MNQQPTEKQVPFKGLKDFTLIYTKLRNGSFFFVLESLGLLMSRRQLPLPMNKRKTKTIF